MIAKMWRVYSRVKLYLILNKSDETFMISPYNVHKIEDKLLVDGSYRNSIYIVFKSNSQDLYKNVITL